MTSNNTMHSTFTTLPQELKHKILNLIPQDQLSKLCVISSEFWNDIKIFSNKPIIGTMSNGSLQVVKNSSFASFEKLKIENLTHDLKLLSSTRGEIPYSNHVVLKPGNSEENILKLWRHYCKYVHQLTLHGSCFSNLNLESLKNMYLGDLNIKSLIIERSDLYNARHIIMTHEDGIQLLKNIKHSSHAMKFFLDQKFFKLETVKLSPCFSDAFYQRINTMQYLERFDQRELNRKRSQNALSSCNHIQHLWNKSIKTFFNRNGETIKKLTLEIGPQNIIILKYMNFLINLEYLNLTFVRCGFVYFNTTGIVNYFRSGVERFKNLKHFSLKGTSHIFWKMKLQNGLLNLIKHNGSSLESMCIEDDLRYLNWMTGHPSPNLTSLKLNIRFLTQIDFNIPHKLNSLEELKILVSYNPALNYNFVNNWILQIAPNLIELELELCRNSTMSLEDTKALLMGLEHTLEKLILIYQYPFTIQDFNSRNEAVQEFCDDNSNKYKTSVTSSRHFQFTYHIECV